MRNIVDDLIYDSCYNCKYSVKGINLNHELVVCGVTGKVIHDVFKNIDDPRACKGYRSKQKHDK